MPRLFAITWRKLMMRSEEHSAHINNAAVNDEEVLFFFRQLGYYKTSARAFYATDWRRRKAKAAKIGKRIGADGRGLYEEKGGGRQVGSFFAEATDNENIKAIYGN